MVATPADIWPKSSCIIPNLLLASTSILSSFLTLSLSLSLSLLSLFLPIFLSSRPTNRSARSFSEMQFSKMPKQATTFFQTSEPERKISKTTKRMKKIWYKNDEHGLTRGLKHDVLLPLEAAATATRTAAAAPVTAPKWLKPASTLRLRRAQQCSS